MWTRREKKKMRQWLIIMYDNNPKEFREGTLTFLTLAINGYIIRFGPTLTSWASLWFVQDNGRKTLLAETKCHGADSVVACIEQLLSAIPKHISFDAFVYSGHGSSFALGRWKKTKAPFLTITELVQHVLRRIKVPVVIFDTCYGGSLSCLAELPKLVKHVVASPSFSPPLRLLDMPCMTTSEMHMRQHKWPVEFLHCLVSEYLKQTDRHSQKYRAVKYFRMDHVRSLIPKVVEAWPYLVFDSEARLDKEDHNLFDVWTAARHLPALQKAILQSVRTDHHETKGLKTNEKVKGFSVEKRPPKKFTDHYVQTKWFQMLLNRYAHAHLRE
jgi:hypothetical protein